VTADTGELPPGASYRVHAEHRACAPLSIATERSAVPVPGVALLRPGVAHEVRDDSIEVAGELLIDPGAHAHDPWRSWAPLLPASSEGRPPFPCRPIVVFLATEGDDEIADWSRTMANGLVRSDVEGRLAMPEVAAGLHLTRPCLPDEVSLAALRPDCIVTLDDGARELAAAATRFVRSLVVIEMLPDIAASVELVSWRRGRTSGRVRARIGRRLDPPGLARLVRRLAAGPHPLAPADQLEGPVRTWTPGIERRGPRWAQPETRRVAVVTGDKRTSTRVDGLVEYLSVSGVTVDVVALGRRAGEAVADADLVVFDDAARSEAAIELVTTLSAAAPRSLIDLGLHDVADEHGSRGPALTPDAARFAMAADAVIAGSPGVYTAARAFDTRSLFVPTLLSHTRALELRRLRTRHERWTEPVVAWTVGGGRAHGGAITAIADALLALLGERPDLRVEVTGERDVVPAPLLDHDRARHVADRSGDRLASWIAHVWAPGTAGGEIGEDLLPFVESAYAGVPTLIPAALRGSIDGHVPRDLLVDEPEDAAAWKAGLLALCSERGHWERRSTEVARRADAVDGPAAAEAVANRLLGWMRFEPA
jgi:hypothetical protein